MRVKVTSHLDVLAADMAAIVPQARRDMRSTVQQGIKAGQLLARDFAKRSAGAHGKHYPNAITREMHSSLFGGAGATIEGEYGPDPALPQGGMSFEFGSRNQPPHLDLARSADIIGPSFAQEVRGLPDKWFW